MKVYILPEFRESFQKKVAEASKHLACPPKMTFSEPMEKTKKTIVATKCDGEVDFKKYKEVVTVIEVDMDEITSGDWVAVADVHYHEGIVGMVSSKYFEDIPKQFGLDYAKCDYCGGIDHDRKLSHIVHNTKTGEWKQIGSSCSKKMFNAGDICKFTIKLYEVFQQTIACVGDEEWGGWCGRIPDHSWQRAYNIDEIVSAVVGYRKDVNPNWEKAERNSRGYKIGEGTTDLLLAYYEKRVDELVIDEEYNRKVREFVESLPDDHGYDDWLAEDTGFNWKLKKAFEDGFIQSKDFYTAFFAVKMYEDSLTAPEFEEKVKGMEKGSYIDLVGATLIERFECEGYYGWSTIAKFEYNGVVFTKSFSNWSSTETSYKKEDGKFYFSAPIDYINRKKREVRLCGSCRKLKPARS